MILSAGGISGTQSIPIAMERGHDQVSYRLKQLNSIVRVLITRHGSDYRFTKKGFFCYSTALAGRVTLRSQHLCEAVSEAGVVLRAFQHASNELL